MNTYQTYNFDFTDVDGRKVNLFVNVDDCTTPAEVLDYFHQFLTAVYGYDTKKWVEDDK